MGIYRESRNYEASVIHFIESKLVEANWTGITVLKTFAKVYEISLPSICVRLGDTVHTKVELGSDSTYREPQILIDIFAENDGQRLDLKDFLVSIFKSGLVFNEYTITNGVISDTAPTGRIRVLEISDTPLNFNTDKSDLDAKDRYRHLISLDVSTGKVEE